MAIRHKIKGLTPLFIFVFYIAFSFAYSGGSDNPSTTGFFNTGVSETYTQLLLNSTSNLLIIDFDGDGQDEIIASNCGRISVYNYTHGLGFTREYYTDFICTAGISNIEAEDMNYDGVQDVIFISKQTGTVSRLYYVWYDGDSINRTSDSSSFIISNTGAIQQMQIGCSDNVLKAGSVISACATGNLRLDTDTYILEYDMYNFTTLVGGTGGAEATANFITMAEKGYIESADYNGDGYDEFIASYLVNNAVGSSEELNVIFFNTVAEQGRFSKTLNNFVMNASSIHSVSSPLTYEFNGMGGGLETVVAVQQDDDEIKIYGISSGYAETDSFGEVDSRLVTPNMIKGEFFRASTTPTDFCVGVFEYSGIVNEYGLFCANLKGTSSGALFKDWAVFYDDQPYDILSAGNKASPFIWTFETDGYTGEDDILTSFGTYTLIQAEDTGATSSCRLTGICELSPLWANTKSNGFILPYDYSNDGYDDLLYASELSLYYIDDGFSNTHCDAGECITSAIFNPCISSVIKVNESLQVQVNLSDADNDKVSGNVSIYLGTSNHQSTGWSANITSTTPYTITFSGLKLNQTGNNIQGSIYAKESDDSSKIETLPFSFSVQANGVVFNDCTSTLKDAVVSDTPSETADNAVIDIGNSLSGLTGLSMSTIWYILMGFIPVALLGLMATSGSMGIHDFKLGMIFGVIAEFVMLILGFIFGFVNIGILIAVVVVALAIVGLLLRGTIAGGHM